MMYPYLEIGGHKLSLIAPFTIDDSLIIEMSVEHEQILPWDDNLRIIRITNEKVFHIISQEGISFHFLTTNCIFNEIISAYMQAARENPAVSDICNRYLDAFILEGFTMLESRIGNQCEDISRGRFPEESRLPDRIRYQNRNGYTINQHINQMIDQLTVSRSEFLDNTQRLHDIICPTSNLHENDIIHQHRYIPTYQKHFMDGENPATTLLLGAEIEVDCGGETTNNAKEVLKIMNGKDTWNSEENIYCVHDGSLSNGLEFPTQPGSLAWHKTLPYKKMFTYLQEKGYKAHDTKTCGLHVHINRSFFGDAESECVGKLIYIIEKFNDEFSIIGRRDCRYAKLLGYNGEKCKELYQKGYQIKDKYAAVNLMHPDTIELRSFKGTLIYSTFMNTLEFVSDLAHFVKSHSEEEIENMEWSDLYNTFSGELQEYYNTRKTINAGKQQKAANDDTLFTFNARRSLLNIDLLAASVGSRCNNDSIGESIDYLSTDSRIRLDSILGYSWDNYGVCSSIREKTTEEKIKDLKKELKNTKSYLAKIKIQKEINSLYKELKSKKRSNQARN